MEQWENIKASIVGDHSLFSGQVCEPTNLTPALAQRKKAVSPRPTLYQLLALLLPSRLLRQLAVCICSSKCENADARGGGDDRGDSERRTLTG